MIAKYIFVGALIGLAIAVLPQVNLAVAFVVALIILGILAGVDWSGQGDGREGCNRHTSCNH